MDILNALVDFLGLKVTLKSNPLDPSDINTRA